ncbi:MAG TPA: hypothetical protein VFW33_00605 [Gemmataceae bacterium]|nr:hypothetical protein [Gemmataceae bacterium]
MRPLRPLLGGLACLALFAVAARAEAPPDPLRFVPDQADFFVEVMQPRPLVEAGTSTDLFRAGLALPPVREYYDSTNARRAYQLLGYFEKELGAKWPDLLDKIAGGGIVLAGKFGDNPQPALLVIQGTDADLTEKFYRTGLDVIAQELARQEVPKEAIKKGSYKDVPTVNVGDFHSARVGAAILVSNKEEALHLALDRHFDGGKQSLAAMASVKDSAKLLPPHALARLWINLNTVKKGPQAENIFASPRNDINLTVLFGGQIDTAARSPYLCAGLYREKDGFLATLRLPAGREGASADYALHVPPADGPGLLPLLEPKDVVYSSSFFLDVSKIWDDRTKLFNEKQAKAIEEAGKNPGVRLVGLAPDKVLKQAGARHRVVVVDQPKSAYQGAPPSQPIPAFAFVTEMRDPDEFSKSMESSLRAAALFAGNQYKLKLAEEKQGDYKIVGWRFPVDVKLDTDAGNIRFNFSPCFVRVRNQFVFCSTMELCRQLVDLLEKETKGELPKGRHAATASRFYGSGGAALLRGAEDLLVTQAVLDQAVTPEAAREQVKALIELVQRLGAVDTEVVYEAKQFRYDLRWKMGK